LNRIIESISQFIFLEDEPIESDIILIPGASRPQLMEKAVELYQQGFAPYILPSGSQNKRLPENQTEWDYLRAIAINKKIPESAILREDKAKNTFDNARLSKLVIKNNGLVIRRVLLICKTYHSHRALMTYRTEFDESIEFRVIPIIDERNITKSNWYTDQEKIDKVMSEIMKIGQYFGKHISTLI
jgi:uncharacterized SAM-binding protein YcdF (DUF218 family)